MINLAQVAWRFSRVVNQTGFKLRVPSTLKLCTLGRSLKVTVFQ